MNIVTDKKLNVLANEAVNIDKKQDTTADKKLNVAADKAVNTDNKQNVKENK